ncbi:MAG: VUT family protein [Clostridia bacterium]|nr:VUT family protein [Clostridia bacterium]MBR2933412.1 VUT family protein [Clostridia bacterium]
MEKFKNNLKFMGKVLKDVPAILFALVAMTLFIMNVLAGKSLALNVSFLALDAGIIVSWLVYLILDIVTKRFGPKHANVLSVVSVLISVFFCLILFLASLIPGTWWRAVGVENSAAINSAINKTLGGTWYVLLMSSICFVLSAFVNNYTNHLVGKILFGKLSDKAEYYLRSGISTLISQFIDNFIFAITVGHFFFGWTVLQCLTCSLCGMAVELIVQLVFSPIGYRIYLKTFSKGESL